MAVICTVRIPHPLAHVEAVERAHPEVMSEIVAGARQYMLSHRRFASGSEVLDIDEYATREDYEAFMGKCRDAVAAFDQLLGDPPRVEVWQAVK